MTDLISRQAVEDLIMETDPWWCEGMTRAIFEGIKQLPTIDPVKHGKWEEHNGWKQCSYCAAAVRIETVFGMKRDNYCPNCGAKNGGEG